MTTAAQKRATAVQAYIDAHATGSALTYAEIAAGASVTIDQAKAAVSTLRKAGAVRVGRVSLSLVSRADAGEGAVAAVLGRVVTVGG